ncbi:PVC-type heme-binding CxxCH protein [Paludisphaera mucosa]|uniref:C-type cytochrome n=1 Tax=Paludisphaera mucosa TaxID=3030827 RepID=A0ABT6FHG7_9BACT|nr:PVC-type heme-binding CxxCH protein [Paludisphaera mucosa]MDG3006926.1 c-type cytochrome [Paludisphaera mucosa]
MDLLSASPRRRALLSLTFIGAWLGSTPASPAQTSPEESAKKVKPAEGLQATLWAAEPLLFNPTSLDVDSRGRVWVAEGLNYRLTRGGNKKFPKVEESDKIKILEDTDGDGKADKVTVFADRIFPIPMGMAVEERYDDSGKYRGCRVYVGNSPNILVLEDTDGDDKADNRFNLLTGFGGIDSDHGVHGMTLGLDGKLYFTHGDGCCSVQGDRSERYQNFDVVDKSGRHVVADKYANTLRVNRDGTEFEVVCDGQRNNYETCRDAFGNGFTSDNDDDGNRGCRVIHTMDGGRFGYKTPGSPRHWGEDVPGMVPKLVGTGNGSPCGIAVYEGRLLPAGYFGGLFEAEAGTRQINFFPLTRHGATFRTESKVLLASDDPWFRPVDMTVAPDGSVFVADWYDAGVGGHAFADQDTGRIYRVAPKDDQPKPASPDFATIEGLISGLKSPCVATQDAARRGLIAKGDASAEALLGLVRSGTPEEAARAIWTASALPNLATIAIEILKHPETYHGDDPRFRELAVRMLGRDCRDNGIVEYKDPAARKAAPALAHLDVLLPLAADPDPGVRRELILALRNVPTPKVAEALRKLIVGWDGRDRWYLEALGLALEKREAEYVTSLMDPSLFGDSGDLDKQAGDDKVALPPYFPVDRNEAFIPAAAAEPAANATSKFLGFLWRLQRPEALPVLEQILPRLKAPGLQQAGDDVLRRVRTPYAADVAALLAERTDDPVRRRMLFEMLTTQLTGAWNEAKGRPPVLRVIERALNEPDWRRQGIAMAAATRDTRYRSSLEAIAVDPAQPDEVGAAAAEAIGVLGGTPDRVLAGLIAAVKGKPESSARAEAAVRTLPKLFDARDRLFEILADRTFPAALRREALRTVARLPGGGMRLVELARGGGLPDDLKTEATTTLHGLGDPRVREAAASVLPPPATSTGRPLPPLAELLRREGDPLRGEAVFFRKREDAFSCGACHRVQGRGQWVGPDLSTVGTKYGKDELLRSVLNPSSAISYNFRSLVLALSDGRVLTGLPVEETPQRLVIKTAQGERIAVAPGDVEERGVSPVSLMPENLASTMTDGELVDLLAYLATLRKPVSVVGQYRVVGPLAEAGGPAPDANGRIDLDAAVPDGAGGTLAWRRLDADAEGRVDFQPFVKAGERKTALAYTPIVSAAAQEATLVVDTAADVAVWHDGRPVALARADAAAPLTAVLNLPAGPGSLTIRVTGGKADQAAIATTLVSPQPIAFDAEAADAPGR